MKHGILSSLLLHPLRSKYFSQHPLLEHPHFSSSEMSDSHTCNVESYGCLISQHHPLLYEVCRISTPPPPPLRCFIFQYRHFPYGVCHISVLNSPLQGISHVSLNLYCMRCLISQYVWVVSCLSMSLRLEAFHTSVSSFYKVSRISTGVSYFSTKLSFMRSLTVSWKWHRRREEIPGEQAKEIQCMNKSLTAWSFIKKHLTGQTVFCLNVIQRIVLFLGKPINKHRMSRLELIRLLKSLCIHFNIVLPPSRSLIQFILLNYYKCVFLNLFGAGLEV
jgi:hypothetical protein